MDRVFLEYYEEELTQIRSLATEFAALHPAVARNLSLDTAPCPDPYVERLMEGVAFLSARTRLKVDAESTRFARNILDALYPDLVGPAPAVATTILHPGPQLQTMLGGHVVERGTRLVAGLREGLATRCIYTTAQDVTLWPIKISAVEFLQDRGALVAAGVSDGQARGAEAGMRITIARSALGSMSELSLDRLDLHFVGRPMAGQIFDAIHGSGIRVLARPADRTSRFVECGRPEMMGLKEDEALLPRTRPSFEGYRMLREYFLMPDRFDYARLSGLQPAVAQCSKHPLEILILFSRDCRDVAAVSPAQFRLFATPIINLFRKSCSVVELDARKTQQVVYADRARPRDYEIYSLTSVEDSETDGRDAEIPPLFSLSQNRGSGQVYAVERRPRRPSTDEVRDGQTRTSYTGDEVMIAISQPADNTVKRQINRLDIRALCTNRDLPILDDRPSLSLESGDPVSRVELLGAFRPPRPSLRAQLPKSSVGETRLDDLSWRLIAQLSLNYLSLVEESEKAEPLRAMLDLYADRGDPTLARHVRSVTRVRSRNVVERLAIPGPICFGHGVEVTLEIDENPLSGYSSLLLSALLNTLFARHAGINSFVSTRTRLLSKHEDIQWPMTPGNRAMI